MAVAESTKQSDGATASDKVAGVEGSAADLAVIKETQSMASHATVQPVVPGAEAYPKTHDQLDALAKKMRVEWPADDLKVDEKIEQLRKSGIAPLAETPDDPPPDEIETARGTAFSRERLITASVPLTGYEPHVLVGALHDNDTDYFTVDEIKTLVKTWLDTPVSVDEAA